MATLFILKSVGGACLGAYCESKYAPANADGPMGLSTRAGAVPLIFTALSFWTVVHGMNVGRSRAKYIEAAKADGETEVEERYALPNLYAQGTSKHARAFNAVQRSHQHIFETFTQALLTGMIAAVQYPVAAGISSLMYAVGRVSNSIGYANSDGDVVKRYSLPFSRFVWYGLLTNITLSFLSSIGMLRGKKVF